MTTLPNLVEFIEITGEPQIYCPYISFTENQYVETHPEANYRLNSAAQPSSLHTYVSKCSHNYLCKCIMDQPVSEHFICNPMQSPLQ